MQNCNHTYFNVDCSICNLERLQGILQEPSPEFLEKSRLGIIQGLGILDTDPEEEFDEITKTLSKVLKVPIALVSIVDKNRQWFKSNVGLDVRETSRDVSFCNNLVVAQSKSALVVEDATQNMLFKDNSLVLEKPNIRFYAGYPISCQGVVLGSLCAIDNQPRSINETELLILNLLADKVTLLLEIRNLKHKNRQQ